MKSVRKWLRPGRALRLRALLGVLLAGTLFYVAINLLELRDDLRATGSFQGIWVVEWRSGRALTEVVNSGLFQFFLLVMGWSGWFRLRQRELAHLRLRRSEQKYRSIINHAGEAIFLLDRDGQVLEWNKTAETLFGAPRRAALGRRLTDLELGLELDLERIFADTERTQRSLSFETPVGAAGPNGQRPLLSMTFSRITPGTGPLDARAESFVVIARDITSQKQLETRMGETEKLAGIGQLAAGIAHQLNTPLGSILLSAQMLEEDIEDEDHAEDVRRIIRQTEQCRGIIKGLLNFARPTGSGRGRMNLGAVISETSFLMEKNLKVASVELNVEADPEAWVYGNRNELEQVFFNLLANALDAMPEGGRIDIRIGAGDPGEIRVEFADSGEGIPAANRDRIFLPFFTTKDYGKGTGLGLSIVARIVHEHGGRIELDETVARGTVFKLAFPRAREGMGRSALIDDQQ